MGSVVNGCCLCFLKWAALKAFLNMKCTRTAHEGKIWITGVNRVEHLNRWCGRHSRSSTAREPTRAGVVNLLMRQRQRYGNCGREPRNPGAAGHRLLIWSLGQSGNEPFIFCPPPKRKLLTHQPSPSHGPHPRLAHKALQGNIDPNILFAPPAKIATEVHRVLDSFGQPHTDTTQSGPTHIFNLGHGISQYTPPEHVTALVEAVHNHSRALRTQ